MVAASARPPAAGCRSLHRTDPYHREVIAAASSEVIFPGAIFDTKRLSALRFHAALYLHGHTVGGTNPSLVEAMAAGQPGRRARQRIQPLGRGHGDAYFTGESDLAELLDGLLTDRQRLAAMGEFSRNRYHAEFTWEHVGDQYERALLSAMNKTDKPRFALRGRHTRRSFVFAILMLGSPTHMTGAVLST